MSALSLTLVGVVFVIQKRIVKERGYRGAYYEPFHQSANKQSRILSNSALVEILCISHQIGK